MKENKLYASQTVVTEGDVVELSWCCPQWSEVQFTIDNGRLSSSMAVSATDSKKFRLKRTGRTTFILTGVAQGKNQMSKVRVRVRAMKVTRAQTVDDHGKPLSAWRQRLREASHINLRQRWQGLSAEKRLAWQLLVGLFVLTVIISLAPRLLAWGLLAMMGYLVWIIMRRR